ncbi:MAG: hypothetical protein ACRCTY_03325 [Candidatus Adiutrix sp.]
MMAKRSINFEKIEAIKSKLRALPRNEPRKVTCDEALNALKDDFLKMQKKGYGPKEISLFLKEEGFFVSLAKIKKLLIDDFCNEEDENQEFLKMSAATDIEPQRLSSEH